MTNEEKILAMLTELQAEVKSLKKELNALRPHVETKEEVEARQKSLREFLLKSLEEEPTPEDLAEVDELERRIKENRRLNAIAAAENAGLKVIYSEDEKNSADAVIDEGRRVAS